MVIGEENIFGFDVAVDDGAAMEELHRLADLLCVRQPLLLADSLPSNHRPEIFTAPFSNLNGVISGSGAPSQDRGPGQGFLPERDWVAAIGLLQCRRNELCVDGGAGRA